MNHTEGLKRGEGHRKNDTQPEGEWWLCPGPEWGTEQETCGRMMRDKNRRCHECSTRRTALRKHERAVDNRRAGNHPAEVDIETAEQAPWNMWTAEA